VQIERYLSIDLAAARAPYEAALAELTRTRAIERMWAHDPSLWKPDPADDVELSNRLGWLTLPEDFAPRAAGLEQLAVNVQAEIADVVVCGMGGSSLAPEVFRQTFGRRTDRPVLHVLDSTDPTGLAALDATLDPRRTLLLISSKSGGTLEVMSFLAHYWATSGGLAEHFAAITDPGTSLAKLASDRGFQRTFLNPTDIGGRYSALSYFGLVPAALAGVPVGSVLDRALRQQQLCAASVPTADHPGALLGAFMGGLARAGRDKLTLLTSPSLASFGLWVEQLIAESTGKEGRGIVPIVGEPGGAPPVYGDDRAFVVLRLSDDDNAALDGVVDGLRGNQPIMVRELADRLELGAEMYCWEVATALAGVVLAINPFDQPNVQESKDNTARVLEAGKTDPPPGSTVAPRELGTFLSQARPGDYVAIQAYLPPTDALAAHLTDLRRRIRDTRRVATTVGFGPRFLHSTGQLHKGGPPSGVFLQLTYRPTIDVEIPGQPFSFGTLLAAQALGDLRSLRGRGLRVARLDLGAQPETALEALQLPD
jgi:glucose-6-phosphate isomerase/transaldolase/glucose-6-phosphate isomerase